jgi:predicted AAA+ superfamily ATPase
MSALDDLQQNHNPWWESGTAESAEPYVSRQRSDFTYKRDAVLENRFVAYAGPAGIGKTTIIHQIIDSLVSEHDTHPRNVLYLPLGNPQYQIGSGVIAESIEEFTTYIRAEQGKEDEAYVFIDDAHASPDWARQVASALNSYSDLTVAVSLPTIDQADFSLLEEFQSEAEDFDEIILPQKFYDSIRNDSAPDELLEVGDTRYDIRQSLKRATTDGDPAGLSSSLSDLSKSLEGAERDIKRRVRHYMTRGGRAESQASEVARNLELTVYRDIPRFQQFEQRSDLHALCAISATSPGETFQLTELSDRLDCDRRTLQRYLDVLRDFFIVTPAYQYKHQRRRTVRLQPRDPQYIIALSEISPDSILDVEDERRLATVSIFDHLKRLSYYYNRGDEPVPYWEKTAATVDHIVSTEGAPLPFALAFTRSEKDAKQSLRRFMQEFDAEHGVIVTRDTDWTVSDEFSTIPMWLLLTIC